ncbi:MAG: hypothetical protein HY042_05810, partial [Spirochaetia bacterium]|nr:hypothetical protein [Spirochaetia bacterium]
LKQLKFEADQLTLTDAALEKVITAHTREAGVRSLKRKLESIARKAVRNIIEEEERIFATMPAPVVVSDVSTPPAEAQAQLSEKRRAKLVYDVDKITEFLGRDRFYRDVKENMGMPGVAIGLAWTPVGGDILYIESTAYDGKGELKLSGQLGDVMKESAIAAFSFIKSHAKEIGIERATFEKKDIHIHIPSGAIPKDGPSAGVTLLTAMASLLSGRPVVDNVAMTGEISLRGKILPVGGIKEKVLAARAAGINTVLLPEKNRPEFEEIPSHVKEGLAVEYYNDMRELLKRTVPGTLSDTNRADKDDPVRDGW